VKEKLRALNALRLAAALVDYDPVDDKDLIRNADEILGITEGNLERRVARCIMIITRIEQGNRKRYRKAVDAHNEEIVNTITHIHHELAQEHNDNVRKSAYLLAKREDIVSEPEFKGMQMIFNHIGKMITDKARPRDIDDNLRKGWTIVWESQLLGNFMVEFRIQYTQACLAWEPALDNDKPYPDKLKIFDNCFTSYARGHDFVAMAPHMYARFFQAAAPISRTVVLPRTKERLDNPAFTIFYQIARLQYFRSPKNALLSPGIPKIFSGTRKYLGALSEDKKKSLHMLTSEDRGQILRLLIEDLTTADARNKPYIDKQTRLIERGLS
jgi:hypothetical protein